MIGDRNQILTRLINTYRKALKSSNLAYTILLEQGQILQNNDFPCTLWAVQGLYGSVVKCTAAIFFPTQDSWNYMYNLVWAKCIYGGHGGRGCGNPGVERLGTRWELEEERLGNDNNYSQISN